jgi:hypothetical protein
VARMASIKVFNLGGLDAKSNDLMRPPEKASDMLNMEYDAESTIKKRNGFDLYSSEVATDMIYYQSKSETLLFTESTNLKVVNSAGAVKTLAFPSGIQSLTNISISHCENQNNIYFTNSDYSTYVMKYDGSNVYRAGLPVPRVSNGNALDSYPVLSNGATGFCRIFYSHKDINGNVTYSPYVQYSQSINALSSVVFNTLKTSPSSTENGFLDKYCILGTGVSNTVTSAARTLTVIGHNYVAGEKFMFDTENRFVSIAGNQRSFVVFDVESVTGTSITFTAASIGSFSVTVNNTSPISIYVDTRSKLHIATSDTLDGTYRMRYVNVIDNSTVTNTFTAPTLSLELYPNGLPVSDTQVPLLNDFYDSLTTKVMPPICKYIASFGNQIAYCSIQSFFPPYSQTGLVPNDRTTYTNDDVIVYSDISTGDGPENTSELNLTRIGDTWDGFISGVRRCNDSLVIFKNKGVFTIDGTLIEGEFQLRKINTNYVGCTSHKSILETENGLFFQGHNGIYFTNGVSVKKLTTEIDSIIGSADYTTTRAVRLKTKQKAIFYIPQLSKIVVIDYYYGQVYLWDGITASNGIVEDNVGGIYFSNGTKTYKLNSTYSDTNYTTDAISAINAYYSTTWHHAGEPSLAKKFNSLRLFGITNDAFTATVTTHGDWNESAPLTTNSLVFSATTQTDFLMLDMQTKRSLRVTFSNNNVGENIAITGYQLNFEVFNSVDKD